MALTQDDDRSDNLSTAEKINMFFQKNRKMLLFAFIGAIVVFAGFIIGITVRDSMSGRALTRADEFNRRWNELRLNAVTDEAETMEEQAELAVFLTELDGFARKTFGFAAARSYSLLGDIFAEQKNWADSEGAYLKAAKAAGKSYLAPVSFFNAAVAAEEQENIESAIEHYKRSLDFENSFPAAARAQFSIGRLEESRNNRIAALAAYATVTAKWPDEQLWANMAHSRIIALSD